MFKLWLLFMYSYIFNLIKEYLKVPCGNSFFTTRSTVEHKQHTTYQNHEKLRGQVILLQQEHC